MGLDRISKNGVFSIVALDHRGSLKKIMNPSNPDSVPSKTIEDVKLKFSRAFSKKASGILLDREYGSKAIRALRLKPCGLIIALEKSGYAERFGERFTYLLENFGPKDAAKMGAEAVKLLIYFNPRTKAARSQKILVENVSKECKKVGIPFICEFLVYPFKEEDFPEEKSRLIIESAKGISRLGIDLLKTEFPGRIGIDSEGEMRNNCKKISSSSKVPWVLLSRGVEYEEFREQFEIASECGASGFMVGRALWQEYFSLREEKEKRNFLNHVCLERLEELIGIASKK